MTAIQFVALACASSTSCGRLDSEKSQATHLIEDQWDKSDRFAVLPIGEVQIVTANPDIRNGQTSTDGMRTYEVLMAQKEINMSAGARPVKANPSAWIDMQQQTLLGYFNFKLSSPRNNKLRCPDLLRTTVGSDNIICVDAGSGKVQEIVRSQKFQIGTKRYWLIMGNHRWKWSETGRKIRDAQRKTTEELMKFMAIAQYDDFNQTWHIEMRDYAPRSDQFSQQREFDHFLSRATPTGSPTP